MATVADDAGCSAVIDRSTLTVLLMRRPPAPLIVVFHGRRPAAGRLAIMPFKSQIRFAFTRTLRARNVVNC